MSTSGRIVAFEKNSKGYYELTIDGATEIGKAMDLCNEHPDDIRTVHTRHFLQSICDDFIADEHYEAMEQLYTLAELHDFKW